MIYTAIWLVIATAWMGLIIYTSVMEHLEKKALRTA